MKSIKGWDRYEKYRGGTGMKSIKGSEKYKGGRGMKSIKGGQVCKV